MAEFMIFIKGGEYDDHSPEEMQAVIQKFINWANRLREENRYKYADKLNDDGFILSANKEGKIVDGPFVESKEAIGGFYIIEATDYDDALEIARSCPVFDYNGSVEVRKIYDYSK